MSIRRATPEEASCLSRLACESKAHWSYCASQLADWKDDLAISATSIAGEPTFVIEEGGQVVGFYQLGREPRGGAEGLQLEHLWIKPAAMGKGHGRRLLHHALREAAAHGHSQLRIDADPNAESFYVACGARRVGVVAAAIAGQPNRVRPQLVLSNLTRSS